MSDDIINETRVGEWIVVDGRQMVGSTFLDCVMELRGGSRISASAINCTFDRCDLVGPWPLTIQQKTANNYVRFPRIEPEVVAATMSCLLGKPTRNPFWASLFITIRNMFRPAQ
jgi:hypothetical protein